MCFIVPMKAATGHSKLWHLWKIISFFGTVVFGQRKKLLDKCKTMYQDKLDKLVHVNNKTLDSDDANTSIVIYDLIKFLADSYNMMIRKTVYSNSFFMINSKKTT